MSMNAKDELRGTLANTICNASFYPRLAQPYLLGGDMSDVLDRAAGSLLAAGYRKPRTITTAEELDALPVKAVVKGNWLAEKWATPEGDVWFIAGRNMEWFTDDLVMRGGLPATVLHEPEAGA